MAPCSSGMLRAVSRRLAPCASRSLARHRETQRALPRARVPPQRLAPPPIDPELAETRSQAAAYVSSLGLRRWLDRGATRVRGGCIGRSSDPSRADGLLPPPPTAACQAL